MWIPILTESNKVEVIESSPLTLLLHSIWNPAWCSVYPMIYPHLSSIHINTETRVSENFQPGRIFAKGQFLVIQTLFLEKAVNFNLWCLFIFFASHSSVSQTMNYFLSGPKWVQCVFPVVKMLSDTQAVMLFSSVCLHNSVQLHRSSANCYHCIAAWPLSILQVLVTTPTKQARGLWCWQAMGINTGIKMVKTISMFNRQCKIIQVT